jgi:cytochrome c556
MRFVTIGLGIMMLGGVAVVGCLPKPKQEYTNDQLKQVDSLEEVMRVQAATMDPQFSKIGNTKFSDADYTALVSAGQRIQTSAEVVRTKHSAKRPPSFAAFAEQLGKYAGELTAAAEAKDASRSSAALQQMRDTCRACHKEHR